MGESGSVPGQDFIGVGVGALVLDEAGRVFMAQRGMDARNEVGSWEFPGGAVRLRERLSDAVHRELLEEFGIGIEVTGILGTFDHILPAEDQHWISITYLARIVRGIPSILEPMKCSAIGWFAFDSLPTPLSAVTEANIQAYRCPAL